MLDDIFSLLLFCMALLLLIFIYIQERKLEHIKLKRLLGEKCMKKKMNEKLNCFFTILNNEEQEFGKNEMEMKNISQFSEWLHYLVKKERINELKNENHKLWSLEVRQRNQIEEIYTHTPKEEQEAELKKMWNLINETVDRRDKLFEKIGELEEEI